jgi:hypothetical protein
MSAHFADLPILDELGRDLELAFAAAERTEPRRKRLRVRRRGFPSLLFAVLVFLVLAAGAASATLLALRGSVIPAPAKQDLTPPMIVRAGSVHLSGISVQDPRAARRWSLRLATSETGLICTTAGELRGKRFGITGLDGRFRTLAPGFVDGCGKPRDGRAAVIEARVFDAPRRPDVRTVIVGYAGAGLRKAQLETTSGARAMPVSHEGAFIGVVVGYPEDTGFRVRLTFTGGKQASQTFGRNQFVTPDVAGALRTMAFSVSNRPNSLCTQMVSARQVRPFTAGPVICGNARGSSYLFDARTMHPGDHSRRHGIYSWDWQSHAARTIVWGLAGSRVRRITIVGPGGRRDRVRHEAGGAFAAVYPPSVDPRRLTVVFEISNGRVERRHAPYNVAPLPERP